MEEAVVAVFTVVAAGADQGPGSNMCARNNGVGIHGPNSLRDSGACVIGMSSVTTIQANFK